MSRGALTRSRSNLKEEVLDLRRQELVAKYTRERVIERERAIGTK
jgi:hypothetical protein